MSLNFTFTPEQESVRETTKRFCQEHIVPVLQQAEETETFPKHIFKEWGKIGLLGARYPEESGGSGMDKVSDCIIREEISFVSQGFATAWSAHSHLGLWPIWKIGTPMQKEAFFIPGLQGDLVSGFGLSEPDGGSNIRALRTKASKVSGGWTLSGSKLYTSNAPFADFLIVAARTRPELTPDAISLFIVKTDSAGLEIHKLKKEGIRCSETGIVHMDEVFVPDELLLAEREGTYPTILDSLVENRVGVSANCLGMARASYEAALSYAKEREVGGRTIGNYQAIGHRLAEMSTDIEAAKWMVYYGAWCVDQGTLSSEMAAKIKLIASETAVKTSEAAIRILGGAGIMREYPVGRIHRDALVYVIGEGTSEIQKNIIARSLGFKDR
jgi:butyryl-CoA dehydrogenase